MADTDSYPIIEVQRDQRVDTEQLGTKSKFWFRRDDGLWLFKFARDDTGEDWAEKVASEIAALMDVRAAHVELASFDGKLGCAVKSFVDREAGEVLLHGNEILAGQVLGYDQYKQKRQSDHTLSNIRSAIEKVFPDPVHHNSILMELAAYLVLDAVISNTDRHHENWGLLLKPHVISMDESGHMQGGLMATVAPSYDHASSLGRELRDEKRTALLKSKHLGKYIRGGRGGIYWSAASPHGECPLKLVEMGTKDYPAIFAPALQQTCEIDVNLLVKPIEKIPAARMSDMARTFAREMIGYSLNELRKLLK
ncbi:MAG: HipA domain-containing protein [Hydrogenophilaceae bacterium]|nr:HipA domain-containing protein [Hydrogenophilaceae bacterium]